MSKFHYQEKYVNVTFTDSQPQLRNTGVGDTPALNKLFILSISKLKSIYYLRSKRSI